MSVSYPLTTLFDNRLWITTRFECPPRQRLSRDRKGRSYGVDFGEPIWLCSYQSPLLSLDECVEIEADLLGLDGVVNGFEAHDTRRELPLAHSDGSFSETAAIGAISTSRRAASFTNAPVGLTLSKGDKFAIRPTNSVWSLHMLIEPGVADANGDIPEIQFMPRLSNAVAPGDTLRLKRPPAHFVIEPETVAFTDAGQGLGNISFSGIQEID